MDAGAGDAAATSANCDALPLCDDFESDTVDAAPDPNLWHLLMGCNSTMPDGPAPGGGLLIGIDSSQHHSGTRSMRVAGGDGCGTYAINTTAFPKIGQQIYARFYARFSGDPQGDGGVATANHNGFLSMFSGTAAMVDASNFYSTYANASTADTGQLRLGCQSGVLDWNSIIAISAGNTEDSTLPDLSPTGTMQSFSPHANEWDCYEFHIDETNNHIEFWFNGTAVPGLTWDGTVVQSVNDQWSTSGPPPLSLQTFGLGWLQLSVAETAWYDDVALAGSRIGCQ